MDVRTVTEQTKAKRWKENSANSNPTQKSPENRVKRVYSGILYGN